MKTIGVPVKGFRIKDGKVEKIAGSATLQRNRASSRGGR
jgi:hypothetical protein